MEVEAADEASCVVGQSRSLTGTRTRGEIFVTNKETGIREKLMDFDFDSRDEVDVSFTDVSAGGGSTTVGEWTFYFDESVHTETEQEEESMVTREDRQKRESVAEALSEALREAEPVRLTAEDYYEDYDVQLEDLPLEEHFRVVEDHFHDFMFKYRHVLGKKS